MKIAIIGTRGIPNNYGGFEQLAEYLSVLLLDKGNDLYVYNSSNHTYKFNNYKGVHIIHCNDPEHKIGTVGQFIYDFNCIRHARKQGYDIILQLGYTSSSIWSFMFPKSTKIVTNMDGLEWKRTKYNTLTKQFLKLAEKWAVKYSDVLIADSVGIQTYLKTKYVKEAVYIPYGANLFSNPNPTILLNYQVAPWRYFLIIARLEPENNIELIIKGYVLSESDKPLIIIGSTNTTFGRYLKNTYASQNIRFTGALYDITVLNNLRHYSILYFHGHSVGGTNPSLLEAMASGALLCAHQNIFNEAILNKDAFYFTNEQEVCNLIKEVPEQSIREKMIENNYTKIKTLYTWEGIANSYNKTIQLV